MRPPRAYHELDAASRAATRELLTATGRDRRVLLRGATILTMDPRLGDLPRGDLLIEGAQIAAVAPDLSDSAGDGQTIVVELGGMVLIPGLCDSHRHCWQNQFRRLLCDVDDLDTYMASTHGGIALHYRPEDLYVGNLISLLGALDSGVTCLLDFSHNSRSAAHSDGAIRAYRESGARVVHASAPPNAGSWDGQWPDDVARLHEEYGSADDLVTVRMGIDMRPRPTPDLVELGRALGVGVTIDGVFGAASSTEIETLAQAGVLGPDVTFVHCTDLSDAAWRALADSGARVTLAPTSDEQIGIADGVPPIQRALDHGIRPSLSVDVEISLSTDLFTQMRTTMATQRMHQAALRYFDDPAYGGMLSTRDVLEFATVQGASDNGLLHAVGTLTPGKQADLVAIRAEDVNNLPLNNAFGTVVLGADARNVDTVFVAGELRKWDAALVTQDLDRVRRLARQSRDRIMEEAGFPLDVLAEGKGWSRGSQAAVPDWGPPPAPSAPR